jgi:hypothetical protein
MDRFLVVSPHTDADCKDAIQQVLSAGYITHFDWGCMDGDHTGWVIIEAENAKEALMVVPSGQRHNARAVKLTKFTVADVERMHHM